MQIMFCTAGVFNSFLKLFILDSLQFQLMILLLQFQNLFLIYDQSGNDEVDKKCSGIDKDRYNDVFGVQCDLKPG